MIKQVFMSIALVGGTFAVPALATASAEAPSVPAQTSGRIMIKFREGNTLRLESADAKVRAASAERVARALSDATGLSIAFKSDMWSRVQLYDTGTRNVDDVERAARIIAGMDDIEYASVDYRRTVAQVNDPRRGDMWHLEDPASGEFGIDLDNAWTINAGASNHVVAVIDSGVRYDHPDLVDRMVPGYDFVSDLPSANDGDERDADANDPGDWITAAESASGYFRGCDESDSSWHGTHVAGTIGATSNNSEGIVGINPNVRIQGVRALGKCGGFDTDIAAAIRWSAGLPVSGVPANPTPAKVINMSLGGTVRDNKCPAIYQDAINEATFSGGAIIIVAAGNSNANAMTATPANCANVITVAASTRSGSRASYSNFGTLVEIAAPGGRTALFESDGVLSTLNTGLTTPEDSSYAFYQGTSMAAPHVAGIVSLMLSVRPGLTTSFANKLLRETATPFPGGSTCSTSTCGAGIANAFKVLQALEALPPMDKKTFVPMMRKGSAPGASRQSSGGRLNSPLKRLSEPQGAASTTATCMLRPYKTYASMLSGPAQEASAGPLTDGGFDATPRAWQTFSQNGFRGIYAPSDADWQRTVSVFQPLSSPNAVLFPSCSGVDETAAVYQRVALPGDARYLTFYSLAASRETANSQNLCPNSPDVGRLFVDGVEVDSIRLCQKTDQNGDPIIESWTKRSVDISAYAGKTVTIRFQFEADDQDGSAWLVDDVALTAVP